MKISGFFMSLICSFLEKTLKVFRYKTKNPPNHTIKRVIEYPKRDLNPHSREAKGF
jgi:hypothetical protein